MTTSAQHDWITLHRLRFTTEVSSMQRAFPTVDGAIIWRFCPQHTQGDDGLPTRRHANWAGLGVWPDRASAEAMMADPQAALPWLAETTEAWHALALPFAHRGGVNWRGMVEEGTAIRPAPTDPGGPLAIVTTAGFDVAKADFKTRAIRFTAAVSEVLEWYGTLPSNLRRGAFNGGHDGREGFTVTLWRSDDAMRGAAYDSGRHRARMDESRTGALMDRSSFTRMRIVDSHGSWDGDPLSNTKQAPT